MYTPSSMSRLIGCDHSMHMLRLNRHNHPKTYQFDQAFGSQDKVGDKEGGSCLKGRRIIFPKGPTINPKS